MAQYANGEEDERGHADLELAGQELGIDLKGKDADLLDIAQDLARPDSLPPGWTVYRDKGSHRRFYNNQSTGESVWEHPLMGYYQGEIFMRRGGMRELQDASHKHPCTEAEVDDMAEYLEVLAEDQADVREVARMAINAPLPPGWEDISDESTGEAAFRNVESGEVVDAHPLDEYFFELVKRRRAQMAHAQRRTELNRQASMAESGAQRSSATGAPPAGAAAGEGSVGEALSIPAGAAGSAEEEEARRKEELLTTSDKAGIMQQVKQSAKSLEQQVFAQETALAHEQLKLGAEQWAHPEPAHRRASDEVNLSDSLDDLAARLGKLDADIKGKEESREEAERSAEASRRPSSGVRRVQPSAGSFGAAAANGQPAATPGKGWGRSALLSGGQGQAPPPAKQDTEREIQAALEEDLASFAKAASSTPPKRQSRQSTATGEERELEWNPPASFLKQQAQGANSPEERRRSNSNSRSGWPVPVGQEPGGSRRSSDSPMRGAPRSHPADISDSDIESSFRAVHSGTRENIKVCVRARPLKRREKTVWEFDARDHTIKLKQGATVRRAAAFYADSEHKLPVFKYNSVFEEDDSTRDVYESTVQGLVKGAMEGFNGTVFAYGQTGSGKTHTIVGKKSEPGILIMAAEEVLASVSKAKAEGRGAYMIRVGILEIYNEEMKDLGMPTQAQRLHQGDFGSRLQIKEDPLLGVRVAGLHEEVVESVGRVRVLLDRGMSRRQTAATKMNDASSRSHTIFRMTIECKKQNSPLRVSVLNFVDLAGSERLGKTENEGVRAQESAQINLSLLMLGNVISKLAEGRNLEHVPFRNSKLTRILQPSLGGNARTAIIATVNPSTSHADETSHTLRFASRAMNIVNTVQVNEVISDAEVIKRYKVQVAELMQRLQKAEGGEGFQELRHLRKRCSQLEAEKEHLLRKVDYLANNAAVHGGNTGSAVGSPPPTPPDLILPSLGRAKGSAQFSEPLRALATIGRVANLGRSRSNEGDQHSPEAVLQAVRVMRAERDELRKRDEHRRAGEDKVAAQMREGRHLRKEMEAIEDATAILEDLVGGRSPHPSLSERLKEAVETSAMLAAEMSSMQRQHATIALMLRQEEGHVAEARSLLADLRERMGQVDAVEKNNFVLQEEKLRALSQRDDFARQLGKDPTKLFPPGGNLVLPGEQAMKYAQVLEKRMKVFEEMATKREAEREELKKELAQWASLPLTEAQQAEGKQAGEPPRDAAEAAGQMTMVGSAAVRAARVAHREAAMMRRAAAEAREASSGLAKRVEELELELGELAGKAQSADQAEMSEGGDEDSNAVVMARMRKRVYALSREVASLTRERDDLLTRLMDSAVTSGNAQVWSALHSSNVMMQSISEEGEAPVMSSVQGQYGFIPPSAKGPASASAAEGSIYSSHAGGYYGPSSAPPQGLHPLAAQAGAYHHYYQQMPHMGPAGQVFYGQHPPMPPPANAWESPPKEDNGQRSNGPSRKGRKKDFDNRTVIPENLKIQQRNEDRALRDPLYGKPLPLEEIELPAPGQRRRRDSSARNRTRPMQRARRSVEADSETLRLRQRLVAAERSRADAVARAADEKRQLELKLAARERAAIAGRGVEDAIRMREMEAVEKAQIAEQFRIERDEMAAAMKRMADENARLKAGMAEMQFYKAGAQPAK